VPPLDPSRLLEHVHGHIGWLAAIALVHPAIVLRRPQRRAHLAVGLAAGVATLAGVLGVVLYGDYREKLRQSMFQHAPTFGYLFERKEHLAFGAIVLTWAGTLAYLAAMKTEGDTRLRLRKTAFWAFVGSAAMTVVTAAFGTVIATYKSF
jgi:hypothetical protein